MIEAPRNFKLVLAYQGTNYAGFQRQRPGLVTIQGLLEEAIQQISGAPVRVIGAGRTDAGVHAQGQVVNFYSPLRLNETQLLAALNRLLPLDILVKSVALAAPEFHARFAARAKTYRYRIHNSSLRPLFDREFVYFYRYPLDQELLRQATATLIGKHDFKTFQAAGSPVQHTSRTINYAHWEAAGPELCFTINGDGFLYRMVRNIVGSLLLVGNGRMTVAEFEELLRGRDRSRAGPTAPARGLCLEEVSYD